MKTTLTLILILVWVVAVGDQVWAGVFKVRPLDENAEFQSIMDKRLKRWINAPIKDVPSTRNLLTSRQRKGPMAAAQELQDVLRICAIRVEFAHVPDPAGITGAGGRFDLRDLRAEIPIDPPPHDRKYFSKHMEALAYYYDAMSYGSLKIEAEVFPLDNDSAYELPDIGDYNPEGGVYTWSLDGLELFFRDAIIVADQDPELDFRDFDAVVIFHAGSDWQNDIYGDTPYDIPSFFISIGDSIAVEDGTHFITDASVVPETTSQDDFFNGINGVIAHEVGHQLGLPDLYDTYSGMSVIGYWDLMDFGSGVGVVVEDERSGEAYYVSGILPASISAWSKVELGWAIPDTVVGEGSFTLEAIELQGEFPSREVLAVPINSYEYYLIENRQADLNGNDSAYVLTDPSEDSTGVIIGPADGDQNLSYEFDFVLPGSGLLIWHVDAAWVDWLGPFDLINAFPERRGVALKEADGIPDLGDFNSFYFLGGPDDPFRSGNNDRMADDTYPNTRSNTGCHSHVVIDQIGDSGLSMELNVSYSWGRPGFPYALGDSMRFGVPSLLVSDLDGDGKAEIRSALKRAYWDSVGVVWERSRIDAYELDESGNPVTIPGWPKRPHGSHPTELGAADFDGDGIDEVMFTDETGHLYAYTAGGSPYFNLADWRGAFYQVDGRVNGIMVAYDLGGDGHDEAIVATDSALYVCGGPRSSIMVDARLEAGDDGGFSQPVVCDLFPDSAGAEIVYYRPGEIEVYSYASGRVIANYPFSCDLDPGHVYLAAADLDRAGDPAYEIIVVGDNGWVWVVDSEGRELPGWGRRVCSGVVTPPAIADANGDGYLEVILNDDEYQSWVVLRSGSPADGWPNSRYGCALPEWDEEFYPADTTISVPSPIASDIDGDGAIEVIQGTLFECITGWEPGGNRISGFPVTLGGGCSATALGDLDGDGRLELVTGGGDGSVYAFLHPDETDTSPAPWKTAYFDSSRNCVYPIDNMPDAPLPGSRLLVKGSFHAFPNPAGVAYNREGGGNQVSFRFETDTGGAVTIEIFDVTGTVVKTVRYDAASEVPKVTVPEVDISDLGSGLYVCRLSLAGNGARTSEFFKLAVKR